MNNLKSLSDKIFSLEPGEFESVALKVFDFQANENELYRAYIRHLGIDVSEVNTMEKIPFLPIEFFKSHIIKSGNWSTEGYFESSGTTGSITSKHYYPQTDFYLKNCQKGFNQFYGDVDEYVWLALLPSYLERSHSSLVAMVDHFIKKSGAKESGFFLHDHDLLIEALKEVRRAKKRVVLLGVTFALMDIAEKTSFDFPDLIVMETGGMKGKRDELVRNDVHDLLKDKFGVDRVHSEYGMTELFSQAYSKEEGIFYPARTMKVMTRDINDPFNISDDLKSGVLNVIDLANLHSCSFIETKDLGRVHSNGSFEVLGRMDNSDVRGCNLMLA